MSGIECFCWRRIVAGSGSATPAERRFSRWRHYHLLAVLICCVALPVLGNPSKPPDPDEVVEKVIERFRTLQSQKPAAFYQYTRSSITEELDDDGNVKKRQQKESQLTRPLRPSSARDKTSAVVSGQSDKSKAQRSQRIDERELKKAKKDRRELILDHDLLDRFDFQIAGQEEMNGRLVYFLTFEPKKNLQVKELQDRILNKIAGKVWIDEQEYEVVRVELRLVEKVTLGWGILAAMNEFSFLLERIRMAEGVWLDHQSSGFVQYRKLFDSSAIRWRETGSGYRKVGDDAKN